MIYLHGFLSSPQSRKALETESWLRNRSDITYVCPHLSSYPHEAVALLDDLMARISGPVGFVGSSLGGFWATYLVENYAGKAVLVNPAVSPHTRFHSLVGTTLKSYYGDDEYRLTQSDLEHLEQYDHPRLKDPKNYKVLLQTGDETLDYTLAEKRYKSSHVCIEQGGNHSFTGYQSHLPDILQFIFD